MERVVLPTSNKGVAAEYLRNVQHSYSHSNIPKTSTTSPSPTTQPISSSSCLSEQILPTKPPLSESSKPSNSSELTHEELATSNPPLSSTNTSVSLDNSPPLQEPADEFGAIFDIFNKMSSEFLEDGMHWLPVKPYTIALITLYRILHPWRVHSGDIFFHSNNLSHY